MLEASKFYTQTGLKPILKKKKKTNVEILQTLTFSTSRHPRSQPPVRIALILRLCGVVADLVESQ